MNNQEFLKALMFGVRYANPNALTATTAPTLADWDGLYTYWPTRPCLRWEVAGLSPFHTSLVRQISYKREIQVYRNRRGPLSYVRVRALSRGMAWSEWVKLDKQGLKRLASWAYRDSNFA